MGQGDLDQIKFERSTISEFETMQQEINITSLALKQQMETIRRMEREQIEQENRRKEQERIAEELKTAREVQANSLPSVFPPFPDRTEFSLYASMTPAKEVGGDFYDFFLIDSDHLALVIADVSGKGVPAALFMMVSKSLIKNELLSGYDPAAALTRVNRQLCEHNSSQMFVTVWLAVVELSTGKGLACNAGHEHPAFRRAGGEFELLKYKHGMFIGVNKKAKYENRTYELHPGDSIFVYTDGVTEATNTAGEMFSEDRLAETLNQFAALNPELLIHSVHTTVDRFAEGAPQFDDITMLSFKYNGSKNAPPEDEWER
jgi:sigma-B regulation protein RsbU (phosphoserine phosphatase)